MSDLLNFKDVLIVATHNWLWLSLALVLGVAVGWLSCMPAAGRAIRRRISEAWEREMEHLTVELVLSILLAFFVGCILGCLLRQALSGRATAALAAAGAAHQPPGGR